MRKVVMASLILLFVLVGCGEDSSSNWFESEEEALEYGLEQEEIDKTAVLSVEEYEGEKIVFYERDGALGIASIIKDNKGFTWERSTPYLRFEVDGDLAYTTNGFIYETNSGAELSVSYGKVFDQSIEQMKLVGDGPEKELEVLGEEQFFFAIHQQPFTAVEILPIDRAGL